MLPFCWPPRRRRTYFNQVKAMRHETDGGLNSATRYRRSCSDVKKTASPGGALNTTPPSEVCLKAASNSKLIIPGARSPVDTWTTFIHNTHRYGYQNQHGGNCCAPSQWADRACGPQARPPPVPPAAAPRAKITSFFRVHPAHRYWYFHSCRGLSSDDSHNNFRIAIHYVDKPPLLTHPL